jgi:hypothetical protein
VSTDTPNDPLETPPEAPSVRSRSVRRPAAGKAGTRPRGRPRGSRTAPKTQTDEANVEQAIRGILQIPAAGFVLAGERFQSVPLTADGATILVHGPALAKGAADLAEIDPRFAAAIEKVVAFGPYGLVILPVMTMGAQFAVNHGGPQPVLGGFGAVEPTEIIAAAGLKMPDVSPDGQVSPDGAQSPTA